MFVVFASYAPETAGALVMLSCDEAGVKVLFPGTQTNEIRTKNGNNKLSFRASHHLLLLVKIPCSVPLLLHLLRLVLRFLLLLVLILLLPSLHLLLTLDHTVDRGGCQHIQLYSVSRPHSDSDLPNLQYT